MKLGGKVVFSSGISVDFDIWCLDLDRLSLSQLTGGMNLNDFPKWSPDGKRIAYISTGDDMIPSLWVMAADGGNKQRLTNTIYCQAPAWSPDGSQIIFCGNSSNRSEIDVCTIDSSGGTASTLFS